VRDAPLRSVDAYIGLGSNLEDPGARLAAATMALGRLPQSSLEAVSRVYRTAPMGLLDQPDFLNAVARLRTTLTARVLLEALLGIQWPAYARSRSPAAWRCVH
jgi:2-amino-4-hydroxy-6-hydroxymethyldihydropteridine diphosphokinase